eukprot:3485924-Amphidinium_carterae.1
MGGKDVKNPEEFRVVFPCRTNQGAASPTLVSSSGGLIGGPWFASQASSLRGGAYKTSLRAGVLTTCYVSCPSSLAFASSFWTDDASVIATPRQSAGQ